MGNHHVGDCQYVVALLRDFVLGFCMYMNAYNTILLREHVKTRC